VLDADNRQLLSSHLLLHVVAPRSVVFERIMIHGRPAFFPADEDAYTAFSRLWNERMPIYESLAQVKVSNNAGLDQVTEECLTAIKQEI
jgi:shikimate kinase